MICSGCKQNLKPGAFNADLRASNGRTRRCRACLSKYLKAYRKHGPKGEPKRSETLRIRLTAHEREQIYGRAGAKGVSVSDWCRKGLMGL